MRNICRNQVFDTPVEVEIYEWLVNIELEEDV